MTVYAMANLGRANRTTAVTESMEAIVNNLERHQTAVLFLNEIDEGDKTKPSDHTLLRQIFTGWRKAHMRRRDPILTRNLKQTRRRWFRASGGVPHQSPARQINESVIPAAVKGEPDVAVLTWHAPAGAHNGQRPEKIRAQLLAGYARGVTIHRERIKYHHRLGRHVVWGGDMNWREFPKLHHAEVQLAHHGPDYIRAVPAKGWAVVKRRSGEVPLEIEALHRLLWVDATFERETA